jgi:hypothetical protein
VRDSFREALNERIKKTGKTGASVFLISFCASLILLILSYGKFPIMLSFWFLAAWMAVPFAVLVFITAWRSAIKHAPMSIRYLFGLAVICYVMCWIAICSSLRLANGICDRSEGRITSMPIRDTQPRTNGSFRVSFRSPVSGGTLHIIVNPKERPTTQNGVRFSVYDGWLKHPWAQFLEYK